MKIFLKIIGIWLFLLGTPAFAAVTSCGVASNHADNAAGFDIAADEDVTPPGGMVAGDFVIVKATEQTTTGAITNGTTGGQMWTSLTSNESGSTNGVTRLFLATYNGTWAANPTFVPAHPGDFNDYTIIMLCFRPTSSSNTWAVDVAESTVTFGLPGSPFDVTVTGQTAIATSGVHVAFWNAGNAIPTWTLQTGGWTNPGSIAQWRNTANNALSTAAAYKIFTSAGTSGNVTNRMSSDRIGYKTIITIKEVGSATPTFTSAPAIGTRTSSTIPVNATTDTTGTMYGVLMTDGSSTPTCDAIEAQTVTGGLNYASEAVVATVADTLTFTGLTVGTVKDGAFCMEDGSSNDSAVATIADMYKLPAFTTAPTITSRTSTTHTASFQLDGAGTCYIVGCAKDSTDATFAQLAAGQCTGNATALAANSKSVTTSADTLVATFSAGYLVYDDSVGCTYGSQNSAITKLNDERAGAASGFTAPDIIVGICSIETCPVKAYNDANATDIVNGDYFSCSTTTTPGSFAITWTVDGNLSYSDPSASRQSFQCKYYDISAAGMFTGANPATFYVNNTAPTCTGPVTASFKRNLAITPFSIGSVCSDFDGDTLTAAVTVGTINTGLAMDSASAVTGTPTVEDEDGNDFTVTFTDIANDTAFVDTNIKVAETLTVPNCVSVSTPAATCAGLIQTNNWLTATSVYLCSSVEIGNVLSMNPAESTEVEPFTEVEMTVGIACGTSRTFKGLNLNLELSL